MRGHVLRGFFQAASLLMLLVVVAMLAAITTMHLVIHGAEVKVPDLKGMTVAQARSEAAGMGLNLNVDNRYYSAEVGAGHILTQSPAPGTVVRREWRVRISESLGPQKVDVPNTVGTDVRVAAMRLRRIGLETGTIARLPESGTADSTVIAQDPPAHAQGIEGPTVNLLVAAPEDDTPDRYVMPDFTGVPIVAAQAQLAKVGIQSATPTFVDVPVQPVGSGTEPPRPPILPGSVIAQEPPAGAPVDQSAFVHFSVAK
jgi:beta-lactam-binding protein with PASTA domain